MPTDFGRSSRASRAVDQPQPGHFTIRLCKGGPRVPARIHFEGGLYWAEVDGKQAGPKNADPIKADGVLNCWHFGLEIERLEYDRLLRRAHKPDPYRKLNLGKMPPLF